MHLTSVLTFVVTFSFIAANWIVQADEVLSVDPVFKMATVTITVPVSSTSTRLISNPIPGQMGPHHSQIAVHPIEQVKETFKKEKIQVEMRNVPAGDYLKLKVKIAKSSLIDSSIQLTLYKPRVFLIWAPVSFPLGSYSVSEMVKFAHKNGNTKMPYPLTLFLKCKLPYDMKLSEYYQLETMIEAHGRVRDIYGSKYFEIERAQNNRRFRKFFEEDNAGPRCHMSMEE